MQLSVLSSKLNLRLPWSALVYSRVECFVRLWPNSGSDFRDESSKHQFDFANSCLHHLVLFRNEKSQVSREQAKVIQLTGRSECHVKKLFQLRISGSATAFRNICGYGKSRSSHLAGQPESFIGRKWRRTPVNTQCERMSFSLNVQLPKILHRQQPPLRNFAAKMSVTHFLLFVSTYNLQPTTYNSTESCTPC